MNFLKNIFGKKDKPLQTYQDFWDWFQKNEKTFYNVVKNGNNINDGFFKRLSPKLDELKDGFFYVTGMLDDNTAELIFTADGAIESIAFIEDFVKAAPIIQNWKFTALKSALDISHVCINMGEYVYDKNNLFFYANNLPEFPDEIDITVVHTGFKKEDETDILNGTGIFLDNYLGELNFAETIDNFKVTGMDGAVEQLIPIEKLKDYLIWRQKEFTEKYEGLRYNTDQDNHSVLEATLENGNKLLAVINTDLLSWENKASHPWILNIEIKYEGSDNKGMPGEKTYEALDKIEEDLMKNLKDSDGYLILGDKLQIMKEKFILPVKTFENPL